MHNAAALEAYFDKNNYFGLHVTTDTMTENLLTAIIYTYIVFNYQNLLDIVMFLITFRMAFLMLVCL